MNDIWALIHLLWGKAKENDSYVKKEWIDLSNAITKLQNETQEIKSLR